MCAAVNQLITCSEKKNVRRIEVQKTADYSCRGDYGTTILFMKDSSEIMKNTFALENVCQLGV